MPQSQEFIRNFEAHKQDLGGLGNAVRIVVENTRGSIYDPAYLKTLREINDKIFLMPGVDRSFMKSLWMPVVRWTEITPEGYKGGAVMPDDYDGSDSAVSALRMNVARAGIVGSLVANDERSSMIFVPLIDRDPRTGFTLDYADFRERMEALRAYESEGVKIHVIGFAQLVGDLIHGLNEVLTYFLYAALIAVSSSACTRAAGAARHWSRRAR